MINQNYSNKPLKEISFYQSDYQPSSISYAEHKTLKNSNHKSASIEREDDFVTAKQTPRKVTQAMGLFNENNVLLRDRIIDVVRNLPATKYHQKVMEKGI